MNKLERHELIKSMIRQGKVGRQIDIQLWLEEQEFP